VKVLIVGAGAWGTTMGLVLARQGHEVRLWARDPERARHMEKERENERYLPGFRFPENLHAVEDMPPEADVLCGAVPTQYLRPVLSTLSLPRAPFLSLAKGIEIETGMLPTEIVRSVLGPGTPSAVLTGPCIAREIAQGLPTAVVVAGDHAELFQELLSSPTLRVYTSSDRLGAELCSALKNVLAVAAGIVDGMGLGDNVKGALLTRGIVEMARLGVAMGAQAQTFTGLAGFGDLLTTCVSPHSRNRGVGERLGRGERLGAILESMRSVAEGVPTTRAIVGLARERGVEMPIAAAMHAILYEGVPIERALDSLMNRRRRAE
jgi:glycerol-3-phosphate dehydrogenase (NAD(P)+)